MDYSRLQNRIASLRTLAARIPDGIEVKTQMVAILGLTLEDLNLEGIESIGPVSGQSPQWRIGYQAGLRHAAELRQIDATESRLAAEQVTDGEGLRKGLVPIPALWLKPLARSVHGSPSVALAMPGCKTEVIGGYGRGHAD